MRLKKIFVLSAIIGISALSAQVSRAQTYGGPTLSSGGGCASASATNINTVLDCRYNRNVSVQLSAGSDSTAVGSTPTVTAHFITSLDGSTYSTGGGYDVLLTLVASSTKTVTTNFDIGAQGWFKLQYATNASGDAITNLVIKAATKPGN